MFFRRQNGRYRETDRVTRYKLIKSGKHWLRASTSLFGLFKVMRGGIDTTQVMTEVAEDKDNHSITGLDIIKGIAATGAVLGGVVATETKVFANEAVALEKTLENPDLLVTNDTVVLGTTSKVDTSKIASESLSISQSLFTSVSESMNSVSSISDSISISSASESVSASVSASASIMDSMTLLGSSSVNTSQTMVPISNSVSTTMSETVSGLEVQSEDILDEKGLSNLSPISELRLAKLDRGPLEENGDITSLVGATAATLLSSEISTKQQDENRKKLAKLSAEMGEYLAKAVGLPNANSAISKVNVAVTEIEKALADPTSDLTSVVQKATLARNSIVNAVLGAHSGQRDSRNGQAIERGASPRASLSSHGTIASIESGKYDRNSNEVVWRINMHANNALHHVGLIADVDPNTTITRVTFNGQEMEKRGGSGNEYVYDIRHDKQRNLEATLEVYATVNNQSRTATLDARVATSSQPVTSADTSGNYTSSMHHEVATRVSHPPRMSRSIAVPNRAAGQSRAASNPPTITMPSDVTFYNDDAITNFQIQLRDDRGMDKIKASDSNAIITGVTSPNYPATSRRGPGDLWTYDYQGRRTGFQKSYNIDITGTLGRKGTAWEPYKPGTYPLEYTVTDIDGQPATARTNFHVKGFNERQDPAKGTRVVVNDKTNLSPTEREQVLANFKTANASLLSGTGSGVGSTDYKKGAEEGSISLANNGDVTITYRDRTSDTVRDNVKYGVEKATDTFYAVSDESLSNINPRSLVRPVGGASDLPSGTRFAWKQGQAPTMVAMGDRENLRTATLTVTHPDNTTTDLTYNYRIYQKIETNTHNRVTGQFYGFKGGTNGRTASGSLSNNIGGNTSLYTNVAALPANTTWTYEYKLNSTLNGTGALQKTQAGGKPEFSSVWNNTQSHQTEYRVVATYPTGRFGTPSAQDRALTSETSFTYTVVDPVAKQEYVTTVGNTAPLNDIISNPSNALKNSNSSVVIPNGTTYEWVSRPDASAPGIYKKEAKVTLPQGSTTQSRNSTNVPVAIKVKPNPPQISADQVTNTGGLPNKGITVTNALPNAQVTLTINGRQLPSKTADQNGRVTFAANELADSNGLLPTGNVTVKQSKEFLNPVTNRNESLESGTTTKNITAETEKPQATDTVVKVKNANNTNNTNNTWSAAPKSIVDGIPVYTFYSGDSLEFTAKFKDNSGVIQNTEIRNGGSGKPAVSLLYNNTWGTETVNKVTTKTTATDNQPATTTATAEINPDLSYAPGNTITRSINAEDFSGNRSDGTTFGLKQGELKDRLGEETVPPITVRDIANLTENDRNSIKAAVEKAYPQNKHRIRTYTQQSNGNVLITYKDGTTRTVTPNLEQNYQTKSDRFYAVAGENANSLTARNFIKSADGTELPANTRVVWKNGAPDLSTPGDKTATLTVTDSKGISKDITYKYTVHQ
uniref:accessory Sec-dependent serine-rich glycoprotein adhesin n=1 Tax=uncultured Streptococcus sp. TaxID=83427 RepID=UPI0025D4473E